ncbi:MAG: hypothetical protein KA100_00105 [Rickettsiales bacterium]|nr:hypothetical protein [Rickettsiales bacterium]
MPHLLKNTVLILVALGLLFAFQTSTTSNFSHQNSAIFDVAESDKSGEKETGELEISKFLNHQNFTFKILKNDSRQKNRSDVLLTQHFLEVPTSPPNA